MKENSILSCLYGQAIGDAMGMPSELWPRSRVRSYFGKIDTFLPGPEENVAASGFRAGEFTDDTSLCIASMDALREAGGKIVPELLAKHILRWAKSIGAFEKNILGPSSKSSLTALERGLSLEEIEANGVTNGAAMRIAPIGCLIPSKDKGFFVEQVRLACIATHKSDIAIAAAVSIAWAISRIIDFANWTDVKSEVVILADEVQRKYESTFSPLLGKRIAYALSGVAGKDEEEGLRFIYEELGAGMDCIESIPASFALVELTKTQPEKCAILAANLGGDTDTIGAMATAICAAINPDSAFIKEKMHFINSVNNIDFAPYANELERWRIGYLEA